MSEDFLIAPLRYASHAKPHRRCLPRRCSHAAAKSLPLRPASTHWLPRATSHPHARRLTRRSHCPHTLTPTTPVIAWPLPPHPHRVRHHVSTPRRMPMPIYLATLRHPPFSSQVRGSYAGALCPSGWHGLSTSHHRSGHPHHIHQHRLGPLSPSLAAPAMFPFALFLIDST